MRCVVLFYFGWLIIFTNAQAASFDCLNAASQQEKLICANEELSVLDSTLNAAYKNALSNRDVPGVKQITVEQKNWLSSRNKCKNQECLNHAYLSRIEELNPYTILSSLTVNTPYHTAILIKNSASRLDSFNASLKFKGLEGKISKCKSLIDLPIESGRGNHSIGGSCIYSKNKNSSKVLVCNDDMLGYFKISPIEQEVTEQKLVDFIAANCFGG